MKRARSETPPPRPQVLEDGSGITFEYINEAEAELLYDEIVVGRCYAKHGVELTPGAFVVDGGANVGLFSLWCAQQAPGLRILAFEPLPPIAAVLWRNIRSVFGSGNDDASPAFFQSAPPVFEVREEALGRETDTAVPFTYYPTSPGESTRNPAERLETLRRVAEAAKKACVEAAKAHGDRIGFSESLNESESAWVDALNDIWGQAEVELKAAMEDAAQVFPCGEFSACEDSIRLLITFDACAPGCAAVTTLSRALLVMRAQGWPEVVDLLKLDVEGAKLTFSFLQLVAKAHD